VYVYEKYVLNNIIMVYKYQGASIDLGDRLDEGNAKLIYKNGITIGHEEKRATQA